MFFWGEGDATRMLLLFCLDIKYMLLIYYNITIYVCVPYFYDLSLYKEDDVQFLICVSFWLRGLYG